MIGYRQGLWASPANQLLFQAFSSAELSQSCHFVLELFEFGTVVWGKNA